MVTRVEDRRVEELTKEHVVPKECAHHWAIETSLGPTSRGMCKLCGEEKEFMNVIPSQPPLVKREKDPMKLPRMGDMEFDEKQNSS